ncbi:MAG: hypothetical protein IJ468_14255 [Lachnospiraceae bacterium]|nr:hypothetical protein [Lachnospiraceae bacterium]
MFLLSLDSEFDWELAPFFLGICFCVTGILQLLKNKQKAIAIIQIVFGAFCAVLSLELTYDWEYIGFLAGTGLLVAGILKLLKKSEKAVGIVEIIFGALTAVMGFECIDWAWGGTGIFSGAALAIEGIIRVVDAKRR